MASKETHIRLKVIIEESNADDEEYTVQIFVAAQMERPFGFSIVFTNYTTRKNYVCASSIKLGWKQKFCVKRLRQSAGLYNKSYNKLLQS